jgi:hypothetical protein
MGNDKSICVCGVSGCDIPFGYCHCGCGQKVNLWLQNKTKQGGVKGLPHKYVNRHQSRMRPIVEDAVPFKIDGVYCRLIPLSQGLYTIVRESDYLCLTEWNWSASYMRNTNSYYAFRRENGRKEGKPILMHRWLLGLSPGDEKFGDHENGNSLDNRRENLRVVDDVESSQNRGMRKDNKTGFKGVYLRKRNGKYAAQIRANKETFHLGDCDTPEEASALYCAAAEKLHGVFRREK